MPHHFGLSPPHPEEHRAEHPRGVFGLDFLYIKFMLHFDGAWRFDSPGPIPNGVINGFVELINRIAGQGNRGSILEHFKSYFAGAAGVAYFGSSNEGWAASDLDALMSQAGDNAPLFIEAFYNACEALRMREPPIGVPDIARINRILAEHSAGYQIEPPNLIAASGHVSIAMPDRSPSLDAQAQEIIQLSLQASDRFLAEGNSRQAVQEILWLLETISTAFRGVTLEGSVQGKYFSNIVREMRANNRGKSQEQILGWMQTLHGYLSSPTGGGIRHGLDLTEGVAIQKGEARLYCNLIKSYVGFLITEHERLRRE